MKPRLFIYLFIYLLAALYISGFSNAISPIPAPDLPCHKGEETMLLIGINTAPSYLERIESVLMTWGRNANVVFYSCQTPAGHPRVLQDSRIPCNEYPPVKTWAVTLTNMAQQRARWYLKCDDDVYVHIARVTSFLLDLERKGLRHQDPYYAGSVGKGRQNERHLLGLNGTSFVMGGPCVLLSCGALRFVSDMLPSCMNDTAERIHSDTQLARCFRKLNISAGLPGFTDGQLANLFRQFYTTATHLDGSKVAPFSRSTVSELLPVNNTYLTIHSIKDRDSMLRVHAQLMYDARPILVSSKKSPLACYHNPQMLRAVTTCRGLGFSPSWKDSVNLTVRWTPPTDNCSVSAKECPPAPAGSRTVSAVQEIDVAYIISLDHTSPRVQHLTKRLRLLGMKVRLWKAVNGLVANLTSPFLTSGEMGLRQSFKQIFLDAMHMSLRTVAIFEEDAILHKQAEVQLRDLFACRRCTCQLSSKTGCTPGVLLLGSTIHNPLWHHMIEEEMVQNNSSFCANFIPNIFGAFAVVYNVELFPTLVRWLDMQTRFPYDWIFSYIAQEGYIVRIAIPRVSIADLNHASSVKKRVHEGSTNVTLARYRLHRWNPEEYV